jgi:hypothetical protein
MLCVQSSTSVRTTANRCRSIEMEEALIASNSENAREGRDVNLGVEGSNSNRHGRELDEEGHVMKILERFQKEA